MRLMIVLAALGLASCGETATTRELDARIEADFTTGDALITCRKSSTGSCHGLFITEGVQDTVTINQGEASALTGLGPATRYCLDVREPEFPGCRPRELVDGDQIVRASSVERN